MYLHAKVHTCIECSRERFTKDMILDSLTNKWYCKECWVQMSAHTKAKEITVLIGTTKILQATNMDLFKLLLKIQERARLIMLDGLKCDRCGHIITDKENRVTDNAGKSRVVCNDCKSIMEMAITCAACGEEKLEGDANWHGAEDKSYGCYICDECEKTNPKSFS